MKDLKGIKILIGPSSFAQLDKVPLNLLLSAGCVVVDNPYKRKLTKSELLDLLANDVEGLIAGLEILDREVMEKSKLKVISRCGSGLSNVDLQAAEELGIRVFSTPDAPVNSVAELTLSAMLSLLKDFSSMNEDLHKGRWLKRIGSLLQGKKVLIIGFGRIGRRLAELLMPFQVQVLIADPYLKSDSRVGALENLLSEADIITIHANVDVPILGKKEFSLFKPGVFLLNASRGKAIDEKELIIALEDKRVAGVWLDVFENEPYSGPLVNYSQALLTPHAGSYTKECRRQMEEEAVKNLIGYFQGKESI